MNEVNAQENRFHDTELHHTYVDENKIKRLYLL